jgi:hypothetical protein
VLKHQWRTRDEDRRLAPAPAIDLAALGEDHAADSEPDNPRTVDRKPRGLRTAL